MQGRTVLVTGSSRGIGFGVAKCFAERGDRVILNGREDEKQLGRAVNDLRGTGLCVEGFLADFSDYGQACKCFEKIKSVYGGVDVLINNAGMAHFGLFTETTSEDWDTLLRHNVYTVFNASHLAVPYMVRAKRGIIINISSVWGITGASCEVVYSAVKGAVNIFTKALAKELGPSGVRVNAIACGAFNTRMNDRLTTEEQQAFTENIPLTRFGEPEEAGRLAFFLSSEEASYLTGQVIALDGGFS